jgi:hypothetical protein
MVGKYLWDNRNALVRLHALPQGTQQEIKDKRAAIDKAKLRYDNGSAQYHLLDSLDEGLRLAAGLDEFVSEEAAKSATPVQDAEDRWRDLKAQLGRIEDTRAVKGLRAAAQDDLCRLRDSEELRAFLAREEIPCP